MKAASLAVGRIQGNDHHFCDVWLVVHVQPVLGRSLLSFRHAGLWLYQGYVFCVESNARPLVAAQ